jgi:hypothetical protein
MKQKFVLTFNFNENHNSKRKLVNDTSSKNQKKSANDTSLKHQKQSLLMIHYQNINIY